MSEFDVTVVQRDSVTLVGLKTVTDMSRSAVDCPALWQNFVPRMSGFPRTESYGASVLLDFALGRFEYWAALPEPAGRPVPKDFGRLEIAGGLYAACPVSGLDQLPEAYQYVYGLWQNEHHEYSLTIQGAASYELYPPDHQETGFLTLYCPLEKVSGGKSL